MVNEFLWYLIEPSGIATDLNAGEAFVASIPSSTGAGAIAKVRRPDGTEAVVKGELREGRWMYQYGRTQSVGQYKLTIAAEKNAQAEAAAVPFVVRRDVEESDLTTLPQEDRNRLSSAGLHFGLDAMSGIADRGQVRARPLWSAVLTAVALLMLAEVLFATWLTRRSAAQHTPAAMSVAGMDV
jgi:hypothetical protein